jgi:hypothetical protein
MLAPIRAKTGGKINSQVQHPTGKTQKEETMTSVTNATTYSCIPPFPPSTPPDTAPTPPTHIAQVVGQSFFPNGTGGPGQIGFSKIDRTGKDENGRQFYFSSGDPKTVQRIAEKDTSLMELVTNAVKLRSNIRSRDVGVVVDGNGNAYLANMVNNPSGQLAVLAQVVKNKDGQYVLIRPDGNGFTPPQAGGRSANANGSVGVKPPNPSSVEKNVEKLVDPRDVMKYAERGGAETLITGDPRSMLRLHDGVRPIVTAPGQTWRADFGFDVWKYPGVDLNNVQKALKQNPALIEDVFEGGRQFERMILEALSTGPYQGFDTASNPPLLYKLAMDIFGQPVDYKKLAATVLAMSHQGLDVVRERGVKSHLDTPRGKNQLGSGSGFILSPDEMSALLKIDPTSPQGLMLAEHARKIYLAIKDHK